MASLVRGVEDLVVEDREVQGQPETDGMGGSQFGLSDLGSILVSLERSVGSTLTLVANGKLGEITVVVTLHLVVEDLGFTGLGRRNQVLVENLKDVIADLGQLSLNLLAVLLDEGDLGLVALGLFFLLDGGDDSPRRTASTNDVLVGNREEIPLLNRKLNVGRGNDLHVLDHL